MFAEILDALVPSRQMYDQFDDPANRSPWAQFWYSPLGLPEIAGQPTANSQFFVSACFAANRLLCAIGATSPLNLMKKTTLPDGRIERKVQSDHRLHKIFNLQMNADQTSIQGRSQLISWQLNWGTGFAEIQKDLATDEVHALWPIHTRRMRPFRDKSNDLWWHITLPNGTVEDIKDTNLIRLPYIVSEDGGITGLGVAIQARRGIGLHLTMERSETQGSKSSVPRVVVESPKPISNDARVNFRREWKELYEQGGEMVALLVEGMSAKPLNTSAVDQQYIQRREFLIEEIARWYDVPPIMIRRMVAENAGNIEQQGIDFKTYSLRFLDVWCQELSIKLLTDEERAEGYYFAFDFTDLLRGDLKALSEYFRSMHAIGVFSANDILDKLGDNPHEGGDEYYVQGAMRPIDEPYSSSDPQTLKGDPKDGKAAPESLNAVAAIRVMLSSGLSRMARNEVQAIRARADNPASFLPKVEEFYDKHQGNLSDAIASAAEAASLLGLVVHGVELSARWCRLSRETLVEASGCPAAKFRETIEAATETWTESRVNEFVSKLSLHP